MSDQLNASIDVRLCNSMSFLTFPSNILLLPSRFQIWCTLIHAIIKPFSPAQAFWNIFQYLMFKKKVWFLEDLSVSFILLNKRKNNILGVWKQIEILVTDTILVLSLQTRIRNIFSFFLDVFCREIHSIYGYGKYLKSSPKGWSCMQILPPPSSSTWSSTSFFFFRLSAYFKGLLVAIRRFYIHKYCTYEVHELYDLIRFLVLHGNYKAEYYEDLKPRRKFDF